MYNRREIKDMEEAQILRYFSLCYPDFPKAKIEKTESPDFILQLNRHHSIGLELTKLFVQIDKEGIHYIPRYENEKTTLIEIIREHFEREFPFRISAHFNFSDDFYLLGLDLEVMTIEILDFFKIIFSDWSPNEIFFRTIKSEQLPLWLNSIDIMHHPENKISNWVSCKVNVPAHNFLNSIQQSIAQKEEKLSLYRKKRMDQYWLLIAAECLSCAAPFHIDNLLERWVFHTHFNQVFLMDLFKQKIHILLKT